MHETIYEPLQQCEDRISGGKKAPGECVWSGVARHDVKVLGRRMGARVESNDHDP